MSLAGFLNVLKPPEMTSHDVVAFVRRRLGKVKVGHLGTLDPLATGVLPLAVGKATRLIRLLPPAVKAYRAELTLGVTTDSHDAAGTVIGRADVPPLDRLPDLLQEFHGTILQRPPQVSALKVGGRRSYQRAREGEVFELEPRPAHYHAVELVKSEGPTLVLDVTCGPGTYIRSLARDLGERLGCGAVLSFLIRVLSGPFRLEHALTLEELLENLELTPCHEAFQELATHQLETLEVGAKLPLAVPDQQVRLRDASGWAVGRVKDGVVEVEALLP